MYSLKPVPGGMMNSARRDDAATVECQKVMYPHFCDSAASLVNTHFFRDKIPNIRLFEGPGPGAGCYSSPAGRFLFRIGTYLPRKMEQHCAETARARTAHAGHGHGRTRTRAGRTRTPRTRRSRRRSARLGGGAGRAPPPPRLSLSNFLSSLRSSPPAPPARGRRPARIIKSR